MKAQRQLKLKAIASTTLAAVRHLVMRQARRRSVVATPAPVSSSSPSAVPSAPCTIITGPAAASAPKRARPAPSPLATTAVRQAKCTSTTTAMTRGTPRTVASSRRICSLQRPRKRRPRSLKSRRRLSTVSRSTTAAPSPAMLAGTTAAHLRHPLQGKLFPFLGEQRDLHVVGGGECNCCIYPRPNCDCECYCRRTNPYNPSSIGYSSNGSNGVYRGKYGGRNLEAIAEETDQELAGEEEEEDTPSDKSTIRHRQVHVIKGEWDQTPSDEPLVAGELLRRPANRPP